MRRYTVLLICFLFFISSVCFAQKSAEKRDYVKLGAAHFAKGDIDGAISYFNKAIAANPQLVAAYLKRGKARRALGELDGAVSDYDKAAELDPGVVSNNHEAAEACAARGDVRWQKLDHSGAVSDLSKAIKSSPNEAELYLRQGRALLVDGRVAVKDFDAGIKLDPSNPLSYIDRGMARLQQGDEDGAQKDFEKGYQFRGQPKVLLQMHALEIKNLIDEVKQRRSTFRDKIA